ncbi:MAG TPA: isoleucine--tRNA ligase [Candidatus Acidoferrum sp.]|nr:isoleucine--tRNA ligase [Candidatus Acidoferrum sp.]
MGDPLELKKTLNLPKTDFPMKAGLPLNEPKRLAAWQQQDIYERILAKHEGQTRFILHDGPPYPTGTIHLGTALNKILKDMVVKSKSMAGYYAPYVPGWDCHGLPIETQVEKELGDKGKVSATEFRRLCREFAGRYVEQHKRDFRRLGVFGRWVEPYLTMDHDYEATVAGALLDFMEKGYVYRGKKPVYWCIHDSTALAEAEVEYHDLTSPSVWVTFECKSRGKDWEAKEGFESWRGVKAVIWTTTPWTLPHNRALAFHPDFEYAVVETEKGTLLLETERIAALEAECGIRGIRVLATWKGKEFEGEKFQHPFLPIQVPGVLADYLTADQGSGIVHTAPGHGEDDYLTGRKYGLENYAPIDDKGVYLEGLTDYKGLNVFQANPRILELLDKRGALLGHSDYLHSYPHCWRCHNPVIFRATEQWFIRMDARPEPSGGGLRAKALAEIRAVKWIPAWGEERMQEMLEKRPDWCISRQRYWGVPIIVFYCEACGKRLEDYAVLREVVKWFQKEGADAWFRREADELLPAGTKCTCGGTKWRKENDILDVWFDSGSSHLAVLRAEEWPADLYLEGPDQYRGWFQSSLLIGTGLKGHAPYRNVVTHGWTLDEHGRPMSKSLGNAVLPGEICEKWGADLLRLWVASQEYHADVKMSERVMTQLSEAYRKIRNTFRFALGNLFDFEPERDALANERLEELDRWMLERTAEFVKKCRDWYAAYEFHRVFHAIHEFCVVELSAFYFDVLKDRLYTRAGGSQSRRSGQTAIWKISSVLARLAAPILVFTCEEIWQCLPEGKSANESIHLQNFPAEQDLRAGLADNVRNDWEKLRALRANVLKELERARAEKFINSSLEAKVRIRASGKELELLQRHARDLPELFLVSQVETFQAPEAAGGTLGNNGIEVLRAEGTKCERCWNYSTRVGQFTRYPTVCERCSEALGEIERAEAHACN